MSSLADIAEAAQRLREGGLVAFPTETVYGLGAIAFDQRAVRRVFDLKGRPPTNPLIVHVRGPEMARRVARDWPDEAAALARHFWPGPLSIVLPKSPSLPELVTAGGDTVAVRSPDHPVALALLFELGEPLVGPSANLSGRISPTTSEHVRDSFPDHDLLVLEGGACRCGIESTVVSLSGPHVRVLRPGVIGADEIACVIGRPVRDFTGQSVGAGEVAQSPGLHEAHYAPRTPARLFEPAQLPDLLADASGPVLVLSPSQRGVAPPHDWIELPTDAESFAAALYSTLREADERGASLILIQRPPTDGPVWRAIADRLARATERS